MSHGGKAEELGLGLPTGAPHHRAFVGNAEHYDLVSHTQFNLLTHLGMREHHDLLDIGCGGLRGGRLSILYLLPGRYFGLEPNRWLLNQGIEKELGRELIAHKRPTFLHDANFSLTSFAREFDFIIAHGIFLHATQQQIRRCMQEASLCMKPSSLFVANFCDGEEDNPKTQWSYPEYVIYRRCWLVETAAAAGLTSAVIEWFHPMPVSWLLMALPENRARMVELAEATNIGALHEQVAALRDRVRVLEGIVMHPWVRLGFQIKRLLEKVGARSYRNMPGSPERTRGAQ